MLVSAKLKASGRGSWKDFLRSPFMIVISLGYMVTYCARTAALDWGQLFLIQELYQTPYMGEQTLKYQLHDNYVDVCC